MVRGIGTSVRLAKNNLIPFSIPNTPPTNARLAWQQIFAQGIPLISTLQAHTGGSIKGSCDLNWKKIP